MDHQHFAIRNQPGRIKHILSLISLPALRKNKPHLIRPFKVPAYPAFPIIALVIAVVSFVAIPIYNFNLALFYFALMAGCYLLFRIFAGKQSRPDNIH